VKIIGIIPARYASTRFPGKPLVDIAGKPMIVRVYEQAKKARLLSEVVVATDDERIANAIETIGGQVEMTRPEHRNGTERCAEVATRRIADYYINVQGDEPFIHPEQIDAAATLLDGKTEIATLAKKITDITLLDNPNTIKLVMDVHGMALYFSRNQIPYLRDVKHNDRLNVHTFYKHIGLYAYRADVLARITKLAPSSLETGESLEQLRWLENGLRIKVAITEHESVGIDAPEDVERALKMGTILSA
jgi:3-deoxy-manno-octulosonate cytidylyltransferase (CMP-KDO synthetase)